MKIIKRNILLILIIIFAFAIRIWQLGVVPPSPDWDEAALGYNAYSILKTGRDEYGIFLPVSLRSFDDYKPPLYMYLTVPAVAIFGLNTWSVRLPAVTMGTLAVWGAYLMVCELLTLSSIKKKKICQNISLLSAFLLAISPWHIQFSRIAFEAGIGVAINIWMIYFFLRGVKKSKYLNYSAILAGLSLYAYHSERIFVPLIILVLALIFNKEIFRDKKKLIVPILAGLITVLPLIGVMTDKNTLMRLRGTSSLSDQTGLLSRSVSKLEDDIDRGDWVGKILDNRRVVWVKTLAAGYLSHYSLKWWFINGDNPRHHAPDMGMLYLWELPFILAGMYIIFKRKDKLTAFLFIWFLIAPIAASPTTELPHGIRTLVFLPVFQIFTAFGILGIFEYLNKSKTMLNKFVTFLYLLFMVGNIFYYMHMYFVHSGPEYSQYWQYGYRQAAEYALENYDRYKKIIVSTKLEQPHMFFLFYTKYDPVKYLEGGGTASGGFREVENKFDKYEFRPIVWNQEIKDGSELYIGTPGEIDGSPAETIYYLDGSEAIKIADR